MAAHTHTACLCCGRTLPVQPGRYSIEVSHVCRSLMTGEPRVYPTPRAARIASNGATCSAVPQSSVDDIAWETLDETV